VTDAAPTVEFASVVFGEEGVSLDDQAEAFHEASRLYPDAAPPRLSALLEFARSPELQQSVARAGRTHDHRPGIDLPRAPLGRVPLRDVLRRRRSIAGGVGRPLPKRTLGALLAAAYRSAEGRRGVPSAGALYPLELYVAALAVEEVDTALYHYHPFRHRLELLGPVERSTVAAALVEPALAEHATALIAVTAVFWRSRFKYGLRGYRFALLEAGHLAQNAVLAATALAVPALPLGGFYDCRLDDLLGVDGLDESSVYALLVGGPG
jgi:SagB-type dehydrogenase family enzyme